jgi:hypothetical protein
MPLVTCHAVELISAPSDATVLLLAVVLSLVAHWHTVISESLLYSMYISAVLRGRSDSRSKLGL